MGRQSKNTRRILYVFASKTWGGGEQYVYDIVKNLPPDEYSSYLLIPNGGSYRYKAEELVAADRVFRLPMKTLADLVSAIRLGRIIRKNSIDIIHVNKFADAFLAVFARTFSGRRDVKVVMTRHLVAPAKTKSLYRYLYSKLDKLIFVSRLAADRFLSTSPLIDKDKIEVIHNSIADVELDVTSGKKKEGPVIIAYAGRLSGEKGLEVLFESLSLIKDKDFLLLMAGTGAEQYVYELHGLAEKLGIAHKIEWMGFLENIPQFLSSADIGILVSTMEESFGLSVLEYMRAGLAVVTTDNGAQPEYLTQGEDAVLVKPSDSGELSVALAELIDDPGMRDRLGANARETFVSKLCYDNFLKKLIRLYNSLF